MQRQEAAAVEAADHSAAADVLYERASRFEAGMVAALIAFDDGAAGALAAGGDAPTILRSTFDRSVGHHMANALLTFGREAAATDNLPALNFEMDAAAASLALVEQLVAGALPVLARIGGGSPRLIREQIGLTDRQNGFVKAFERRVRARGIPQQRKGLLVGKTRLEVGLRLQRAVDAYRDGWRRRRAERLVQQHLLGAVNATYWATWMAAADRASNDEKFNKFWVDRDDQRVRDHHREIAVAHPAGIPLRDTFVTRHGELRYPLDPRGHAEDVNGCRCTAVVVRQGA